MGGILVMPCEDDLLKIIRSSDNTWEIKPVLPVSFSTLQLPEKISNFVLNRSYLLLCLVYLNYFIMKSFNFKKIFNSSMFSKFSKELSLYYF